MVSTNPRRTSALASLLVGVLLLLGSAAVPAGAEPEVIEPPSELSSTRLGDIVEGPGTVPACGSANIDGTRGEATWTITSSLGDGSIIYPGREWTVTATMEGGITPGVTYEGGNNGPDPLYVALQPSGPVEQAAPTTGEQDVTPQMQASGYEGPVGPGPTLWSWEFDLNSQPGYFDLADSLHPPLTLTVHYRATAPGVITLHGLHVDGVDGTPSDADGGFQCTMVTDWSWTVVAPELPTSATDVSYTDASYDQFNLEDRSGGAHGVVIDVLANDDDPNIAGGPGDLDEVRIRDWSAQSALGGTVSCGSPDDKNEPTFAEMSVGPCVYTPPANVDVPDSFIYVLASATGPQRQIKVNVHPLRNIPPFASDTVHGGLVNTPETFDLNPVDLQGDPIVCIAEQHAPDGGDLFVDTDCTADWTPDPGFTGSVDFSFVACDQHATLTGAQLGLNTTRAPGYHLGSPDDLSSTTAQRCTTIHARVVVLPGGIIPPVGVADDAEVDANYPGPSAGPFSIDIPVLENDYDGNGPDPSDAASGVVVEVLDGPDPALGTATVLANRSIRFTPASGVSGPVGFTYRLCEDPAQQQPPYVDNPNTPGVDEGLPFCGVGAVQAMVLGNLAPDAQPDQRLTLRDSPVTDFDVAANDSDPEGTDLACTPGPLGIQDPELIAAATIDADCLVDVTPVAGATGVGLVDYEVCDSHLLADVPYATDPYGPGAAPGDPAPRCASSTLELTVIAPLVAEPVVDPLPTCGADAAATAFGTPAEVLVLTNDSDLDIAEQASPLEVIAVTSGDLEDQSANGGSALPADDGGSVLYSPPAGFSGADTFQYLAVDTIGQVCEADVTVQVAGLAGGGGGGGGGTGGGGGGGVGGTGGGSGTGAAGDTLARTGAPIALWLGVALALLGVGGLLSTQAPPGVRSARRG